MLLIFGVIGSVVLPMSAINQTITFLLEVHIFSINGQTAAAAEEKPEGKQFVLAGVHIYRCVGASQCLWEMNQSGSNELACMVYIFFSEL